MIKLGYCKITNLRTKFFYQQNGKELEFYIDRDPETGLADLWIRPGVNDATNDFIVELVLELTRAKSEEKPKEPIDK